MSRIRRELLLTVREFLLNLAEPLRHLILIPVGAVRLIALLGHHLALALEGFHLLLEFRTFGGRQGRLSYDDDLWRRPLRLRLCRRRKRGATLGGGEVATFQCQMLFINDDLTLSGELLPLGSGNFRRTAGLAPTA